MYPDTLVFVHFWHFFCSYLFARAPFANANVEVDRGRPSGRSHTAVSRRGLGAIRAVCRAWRGLRSFFRLEWTISPVFLLRRYFVPGILHFSKFTLEFFAHTYLFENGTACHNSDFPVHGQVWCALSSKSGPAAPCAVCHVCICRV